MTGVNRYGPWADNFYEILLYEKNCLSPVAMTIKGDLYWRLLVEVEISGTMFYLLFQASTLWGCGASTAAMEKDGCIVNVSSLAGKRGSANNSVYCAAKFAVNGITQALARELGPRGIRVNAVCPVYVETEHIRASLAEPASLARTVPVDEHLASFAASQTALGRLPCANEVAEAIDQSRIVEHDVPLCGVEFSKGYPGINEPREVGLVEKCLDEDPAQQRVLARVVR